MKTEIPAILDKHKGDGGGLISILEDIQAKYSYLPAEALKLVAEGGHSMTPVGRFSDKIRNLEDMLLVALIDGDLTPTEKKEMLAFVKKINLTKDQVKSILAETKLKISLRQTSSNCIQCGTSLAPECNFCTCCGQKIGG